MRSAAASVMTGPSMTSGRSGSPIVAACTWATSFSTKLTYTDASTRIREAQAQLWPAWVSGPWWAAMTAAVSRSASANTR